MITRISKYAVAVAALLSATGISNAAGKINVVTATQDLAALGAEVGGDRITIEAIAKGYQDPHFVEPKPSFLLKLQKADLLAVVGLQLEIGWLPPLITQSGNPKIQVGANGYLDMSQFCQILEIPTGQVTRAQGDVHPLGNPHYWLDPENGRRIAKAFQSKFSEMRPNDAAYFAQRYSDFDKRLTEAESAGMQPWRRIAAAKSLPITALGRTSASASVWTWSTMSSPSRVSRPHPATRSKSSTP
jgi:zinc/manganese transport system substrate-binding protein